MPWGGGGGVEEGCRTRRHVCLVCLGSSVLINYSLILTYHPITRLFSTNSAINLTLLLTYDALSNKRKKLLKTSLLSTIQIS